MIKFDQYLTEKNVILQNYKKFVVSIGSGHFKERLENRSDVSMSTFKKQFIPKICKKIKDKGLKLGSYAIIIKDKFTAILRFTPNRIQKSKHDLFLITCLAPSMSFIKADYKMVMEYIESDENEFNLEQEDLIILEIEE